MGVVSPAALPRRAPGPGVAGSPAEPLSSEAVSRAAGSGAATDASADGARP